MKPQQKPAITPAVIRRREAVIYVGVSESTLRNAERDGELTPIAVGRVKSGKGVRVGYLRADLDRWIESRKQPR